MKKLIFILTTVFAISSFAAEACPEGDRNCTLDKHNSGFIAVGSECAHCMANELGEPRIESPKNGNVVTDKKEVLPTQESNGTGKTRK